MTILFNITYTATYDEEILLNLVVNRNGLRCRQQASMTTTDGHTWTYKLHDVTCGNKEKPYIDYFFTITRGGREYKHEWTGMLHRIDLNLTRSELLSVNNVWHERPDDTRFYTTAFTECLQPRAVTPAGRTALMRTIRLIVRAPELLPGERLAIVGSNQHLGEWNAQQALPMTEHNHCEWQADINAANITTDIHYKYVAIDSEGNAVYEANPNRSLEFTEIKQGEAIAIETEEARFNRPTPQPTCLHTSIAQLGSADGFGIGNFGSLAKFIAQTAASAKAQMIYIPPVCDSISTHTNADANPYSSISAFALHPLLCDLSQLPTIADPTERERMDTLCQQLGSSAGYDYTATLHTKLEYLRCVFNEEGDHTLHSADYRRFFTANERWLVPYAQFSYLRDAYGIADFRRWPSHNEWTEAERGQLQNARTKAYKKLAFFYYVQYVLHCQLRSAHDTARQHGIVLAGDMTANINPNGCDVWQEQSNVGTDEWWTRRLAAMQLYYDACRVPDKVARHRQVADATRIWLTNSD